MGNKSRSEGGTPPRFLRLPQVIERVGFGKSEIYRRIAAGEFPASKRLSHKKAVWVSAEITDWQIQQLAMSDPEVAKLLE